MPKVLPNKPGTAAVSQVFFKIKAMVLPEKLTPHLIFREL
jgi:hypothetical protein